MAVQAQYPSNILLINRNVQESKNGIGGFLEESHTFFNNNEVEVNPRKRSREDATIKTPTTTTTLLNSFNFSLNNQQQNQNNNNQFIDLSQLQNQQQHPSVVSTGLKLSFGEQKQQNTTPLISLFSEELGFQFKQHNDQLNYFLHTQGEQLKRTLAEKSQRHYCALLGTTKEVVAQRVQEKEVEVEAAMRRNVELQGRMAQINVEAQTWQAKAMDHEAQVVSLKAQIQHVMVNGPQQQNSDVGSAYVDPTSERGVNLLNCRACQTRAASVVLLPCRHMCICVKCDKIVQACPVCYSFRSAGVEVCFS